MAVDDEDMLEGLFGQGIGGDDDGKNDELFVPGLARGPAGSNCQEGRNSGTDTTRHWDDDVRHYDGDGLQ